MRQLLLGLLLALTACGPRVQAQALSPPPDPAVRGPYPVGVTMRFFKGVFSANGRPRDLVTYIWYPAVPQTAGPRRSVGAVWDASPNRENGPYPVLTWSHGFTGSPVDSVFLVSHLASHGFVVVAPAHRDREGAPPERRVDRPEDISFVLDQAIALSAGGDAILGGLVDPTRVGGGGHSFGGWTTLNVMAAKHSFKAAAIMAPGTMGTPLPVAGVDAPVMLLAGELDATIRLPSLRNAFDSIPPATEHWLVTLLRGNHFSFTDRCIPGGLLEISCADALPQDQAHELVNRLATAFLLLHVAGQQQYALTLENARSQADPRLAIAVSKV